MSPRVLRQNLHLIKTPGLTGAGPAPLAPVLLSCAVHSCQNRRSSKSRTRTERSRLLGLIIPVLLARRIPRLLLCPDASSPPAAPLQRWFQPGNADVGVDVGRTTAFNPPPPHTHTLWFDFHAAEGICVFFVARMMSLQSSFCLLSLRIRVSLFARRRPFSRRLWRVRGRRGSGEG